MKEFWTTIQVVFAGISGWLGDAYCRHFLLPIE